MMSNYRVILASNSPRRKELLAEIVPRKNIIVIGSNVKEEVKQGEDAVSFSLRMAKEKARDVIKKRADIMQNVSVVIGADTIAVFDNKIIGQPICRDNAVSILRKLSGRCHEVITGVAIFMVKKNKFITFTVKSTVWMHKLSDEMIEKYVASGEPMDKAGAYAIQGMGKILIKRFEGSYTNIIGLPVDELRAVLLGIS
jgi:septum formation protein